MHYFSRGFLAAVADQLKQQGRYHIAHKKIPSKDGPVQVSLLTCCLGFMPIPRWQPLVLTYINKAFALLPIDSCV